MDIQTIEYIAYKDYKIILPAKIKIDLDLLKDMHQYMSGSDIFLFVFRKSLEKYSIEQFGVDTDE